MTEQNRSTLGLPLIALVGLALLAVPRVVLHDLGVIHEGTLLNALFVFVPPIVWIAVAVLFRVPKPFLALLVVGVFYGVFLAIGHQLLWNAGWDGDPPTLGGNLSGLPPLAHALITRAFAAVSSLVTGTLVGAVSGLVAWGVSALLGSRSGSASRAVRGR